MIKLKCPECESEDIEEFDDKQEREIYIWKHTDQNGKWNQEELPQEERNKEIGEELMIEEL